MTTTDRRDEARRVIDELELTRVGRRVEGETEPSRMMRGEVPLPAGAIRAKEMKFDELYVTYHKDPTMMRLLAIRPDRCQVTFYVPELRDWLQCDVPLDYPLGVDIDRLVPARRPPSHGGRKIKKGGEGRPFERKKEVPAEQADDGKRCFKGVLGTTHTLFDAGSGKTVGTLLGGKTIKESAQSVGYELVSQGEASERAMWVFEDQWRAVRAKIKAESKP